MMQPRWPQGAFSREPEQPQRWFWPESSLDIFEPEPFDGNRIWARWSDILVSDYARYHFDFEGAGTMLGVDWLGRRELAMQDEAVAVNFPYLLRLALLTWALSSWLPGFFEPEPSDEWAFGEPGGWFPGLFEGEELSEANSVESLLAAHPVEWWIPGSDSESESEVRVVLRRLDSDDSGLFG